MCGWGRSGTTILDRRLGQAGGFVSCGEIRYVREGRRMAIWLAAYLTAMLVNASFDVYIENPMGGVWLWALVGAALVLTSRPPEGQR
ncbi:MAG: hypothetical protein GXP47_13060 [Acidobacteria bacterium]|nr:hypothetical protein [Acidobacteriota bacterium]